MVLLLWRLNIVKWITKDVGGHNNRLDRMSCPSGRSLDVWRRCFVNIDMMVLPLKRWWLQNNNIVSFAVRSQVSYWSHDKLVRNSTKQVRIIAKLIVHGTCKWVALQILIDNLLFGYCNTLCHHSRAEHRIFIHPHTYCLWITLNTTHRVISIFSLLSTIVAALVICLCLSWPRLTGN